MASSTPQKTGPTARPRPKSPDLVHRHPSRPSRAAHPFRPQTRRSRPPSHASRNRPSWILRATVKSPSSSPSASGSPGGSPVPVSGRRRRWENDRPLSWENASGCLFLFFPGKQEVLYLVFYPKLVEKIGKCDEFVILVQRGFGRLRVLLVGILHPRMGQQPASLMIDSSKTALGNKQSSTHLPGRCRGMSWFKRFGFPSAQAKKPSSWENG